MPELKDRLLETGIAVRIFGDLPGDIRAALPLWALKGPKPQLVPFVKLAEVLGHPLVVLVDDSCARGFTKRTEEEQLGINQLYLDFFSPFGCEVKFSSDFSEIPEVILEKMDSLVSIQGLIHAFPEKKRGGLSEVSCAELMHAVLELSMLGAASAYANTLLMGKFSARMAGLYRKVQPKPLPVILTPRFKDESHVLSYCSQLEVLA